MGEYIKTIVSSVLAVGLISALLPTNGFSKYVNILSGIIVMAVIVSPIINTESKSYRFDEISIKNLELNANSYIMEEYEKELAQNIKSMLKSKTNTEFSVMVYADKEEDVIEIKKIEISPYTSECSLLICEYLGIDEGRITQK